MTEQEWLQCTDPELMLKFLQGNASDRKLRLFAVACCRQVWRLCPPEGGGSSAVLVSERFADHLASKEDLKAARKRALSCEYSTVQFDAYTAATWTSSAAARKVRQLTIDYQGGDHIAAGYSIVNPAADRLAGEQSKGQSALLRDIMANPFRSRPRLKPAWLAWNESVITRLAAAAYEERHLPSGNLDPVRLAVLSDALEGAGCTDTEILHHLRSAGPHVRGCWVVDLLLGKS